MTPENLVAIINDALTSLIDQGLLELPGPIPDDIVVERPKIREHGDYSTNIAMRLAKQADKNPRELASMLATRLSTADAIADATVAGPGFLNVHLGAGAQGRLAAQILTESASYGLGETLSDHNINLEFISANPTGPLHLGHTRWAAVGDALARVMSAAGADVTREFYINDRGSQLDKFGASVLARAQGSAVPDDGYHGQYIDSLAEQIIAADPKIGQLPPNEQQAAFREASYTLQLAEQKAELAEFRTHFDVWFSERSLHDSGAVTHALQELNGQGRLVEHDRATWMRTTDFGDDKDRVLVRGNGELTYFASDTAYYVNKRERGFDTCIYLLGADHHGYIGRLSAMAACIGDSPGEHLVVMIGQMVKILQDGAELKLSKRAGTIVSLRELMDLIGVDALRYTLIRYPVDSPLTLDVSEMTRKSSENPVYYVQYAHARLSSILRNAADLGIGIDPSTDLDVLTHEREADLLRALAEFPRIIERSAQLREPHRIARYMEDTAAVLHKFYDTCHVLPRGDEPVTVIHRARLVLVAATRQVFANALSLLGVSAPERM